MRELNFMDKISGEGSTVPWSAAEAIEHGFTRWMDRDGCFECDIAGRHGRKIRYVEGNHCTMCANIRFNLIWSLWCQGEPSRPEPWAFGLEGAAKAGTSWYFGSPNHPALCENGPHPRKTHIKTLRCVACDESARKMAALQRGPRAAARAAGYPTYIPTETCPACGQLAPRNVVNNSCHGCKGEDKRRSQSQRFAEENPEFVIDKETAKALGFTLYRTGNHCRKGHAAYRYVSTGNCLECLKNES